MCMHAIVFFHISRIVGQGEWNVRLLKQDFIYSYITNINNKHALVSITIRLLKQDFHLYYINNKHALKKFCELK